MPAVCPACRRSLLDEDTKTDTMLKNTHTSLRRIENWLVENELIVKSTVSSMNAAVLAQQISTQLEFAPKVNRDRIAKIMGIFEQLQHAQESTDVAMSADRESSSPINIFRFPTPPPPTDSLAPSLPRSDIPAVVTISPRSISRCIPQIPISADMRATRTRYRSVEVESSEKGHLPVTSHARHQFVNSTTPTSAPSRQLAHPSASPRIQAAAPYPDIPFPDIPATPPNPPIQAAAPYPDIPFPDIPATPPNPPIQAAAPYPDIPFPDIPATPPNPPIQAAAPYPDIPFPDIPATPPNPLIQAAAPYPDIPYPDILATPPTPPTPSTPATPPTQPTPPTHARTQDTTVEFSAELPACALRKPALRSPIDEPSEITPTYKHVQHAPSESTLPHSRTRHTSVDTATAGALKLAVPSASGRGNTLTKTPRYVADGAAPHSSCRESRSRHQSVDTGTAAYQSQKPYKNALVHASASTAPAHDALRRRSSHNKYGDNRGAVNTADGNTGDNTASAAPVSEHAHVSNVTTPARSNTAAGGSSGHQPRHNSVDGASRHKMPASDARPRYMSVDTATSAAHGPKAPLSRRMNRSKHNISEASTSPALQPKPPPSISGTDVPRHAGADTVTSAPHGSKTLPSRTTNPPQFTSCDLAKSTECPHNIITDAAIYQAPPSSTKDPSGDMTMRTITTKDHSGRQHHTVDSDARQPNLQSSSNSDRDIAEANAFRQLVYETSSKCATSASETLPDCDPSRPFSSHEASMPSNGGFDPTHPLSGFDPKTLHNESASRPLTLNGFTKSTAGRCSPALSFTGRGSPPLSMCSRGTPPLSDQRGYMGRASPTLSDPQLGSSGQASPPPCDIMASPPVQRRTTAPVRRVPYPTKKSSQHNAVSRTNASVGGRITASGLTRQAAGGSPKVVGCARERQLTPAFRHTDNIILGGRPAAMKQGCLSRSKEARRSTLLAAAMAAAHNNSAHSSASSKMSPTTLQKTSFESCKSDLSTPLTRVPENIAKHSTGYVNAGSPYIPLRSSNAVSTTTQTAANESGLRKPSVESMRSESHTGARDPWR